MLAVTALVANVAAVAVARRARYLQYAGRCGVELRSLWRRFVFGWRFGGTGFLVSRYPRPDSRVVLRRQIRERVSAPAPFLTLDGDPGVVLADGQLHWTMDAYTTSAHYSYSQYFASRRQTELGDATERLGRCGAVLPHLDGVNHSTTGPAVFCNQRDLWVRDEGAHHGRVRTVEPYYIIRRSVAEQGGPDCSSCPWAGWRPCAIRPTATWTPFV